MIPDDGLEILRDAISAAINGGQVGTGTTAPASGDTALKTVSYPTASKAGTANVVKDTGEFDSYFTIPATGVPPDGDTITEVGFFQVDKLFSRHTFTGVVKNAGISWRVTLNVQISEA